MPKFSQGINLACPQQNRVSKEGRGYPEILRLRSYQYITTNYIYQSGCEDDSEVIP